MAPGINEKNIEEKEGNNNEKPEETSDITATKVPDSSQKNSLIQPQPNQKSQEELHSKPSLFGNYKTTLEENTSQVVPTIFGNLLKPNIGNIKFGVENISKPCTTEPVANTPAIHERSEVEEIDCSSEQLANSSVIAVDYDISLDTNISKGTFLDRNYLKDDYQIPENPRNIIFGVKNISKPCTPEPVANTPAIHERSEVDEIDCSSEQLANSSVIAVDYDISLDSNISKGTFLDRNYLKDDYQIPENNSIPILIDDIPEIANCTEGTINKACDENINDQCNEMEKTAIVENNLYENLNERETNVNCVVFDSTKAPCTQKRDMSIQPFVVRVQRMKTPTIPPTSSNGLNLSQQKTKCKNAHRKLRKHLIFNEDSFQMSVTTQTPYNLRTTKARTKHKKQELIIIKSKKNNKKQQYVTEAKIGQKKQRRVIDFNQSNANDIQQLENLRSEDPQSSRNLRRKHVYENYLSRFKESQLNRLFAAEIFNNSSRDEHSTGCQYCRIVKRLQRHTTRRRDLLHDILHKNIYETNPELISHILHSVNAPERDTEVPTSNARVPSKRLLKLLKDCLKKLITLVTYLDFNLNPHANDM